jgi:UDP-N-acetylglucosamine 2-epimerase (non-hydrolysing)
MVLTDSGGIQEETTALGVPCLTCATTPSGPSRSSEGTNRLVGSDPAAILAAACEVLDGARRPVQRPDLWDGHAAERIVDVLERDLAG